MLNKLLSISCPEEGCPVRKTLSKRNMLLVRIHTALKTSVAVLLGVFIGSMFLLHHASGQSQSYNQFKQQQESGKVIELSVQVNMLSASVHELTASYAQLKSEADTTQAMGAGIGIAIMFLQLLGFFVKSRTGN